MTPNLNPNPNLNLNPHPPNQPPLHKRSCDVASPNAVPSPLPSDGRGEGQGEVRVPPNLNPNPNLNLNPHPPNQPPLHKRSCDVASPNAVPSPLPS
ncbi:MAG: hypothetical protein ABSG04_12685, partial [Verrucomicrobiota bacterium]